MAPLSVEKNRILTYIANLLGEEGQRDVQIGVSYPAFAHELPHHFSRVESLELHYGLAYDREKLTGAKQLAVDLYLPQRNLYIELDRAGHDLTTARAVTFQYYPAGLPKGFRLDHYRNLIAAAIADVGEPQGAGAKMNQGRSLVDFAKDLYIEGEQGATMVRLPKSELTWLLDRTPEAAKLAQLQVYLAAKAAELDLPALRPGMSLQPQAYLAE